jgi:hypothetical protein
MRSRTGPVRAGVLAVLVALVLVLPGYALSSCGVIDGKHQVGERMLRWTQGKDGDLGRIAALGTVVIADNKSRDEFLALASEEVNTEPIATVDLTHDFLVVGSFHRCKQQSRLQMNSARTAVWMEIYVPRKDRNTECVMAPTTVDIYRVDRSELSKTPAERLKTADPRR